MKITIRGLTESVLSINSIGIILRGNKESENNTCSVARHLEVSSSQLGELEGLQRAGLIEIEYEDKEINTLNKTNQKKDVKVFRAISKVSKVNKDEEVVVVTPGGVKKTSMYNRPVEIEESSRTEASLKAMQELEREEREQNDKEELNENKSEYNIDPTLTMGAEALIVVDGKSLKKVAMKHSITPEADSTKEINYIENKEIKNETPVKPKKNFLKKRKYTKKQKKVVSGSVEKPDAGDAFIEM